MEYVVFAIKFLLFLVFIAVLGGYAYFVYTGDLPNPVNQLPSSPTAANTTSKVIIFIVVAICCVLASIAPFIYACRSGDVFTVIVSIVALVACFTILTFSRTVIDMVLAAIVYFTSAFISIVMFAANRISEEIRKMAR